MPISPLAAAYMTGQGGGNDMSMMGVVDPALIAAQPELQLAQGMEQQGISTAPAYPGAAIARALQGAIGAGLQKSTLSDLAKAYSGVPDEVANVLDKAQPGNPASALLHDPNPMVRMLGWQMAQKTIPIQAELQKTGPGQVVTSGPSTVTANQQPQSDEGKRFRDAQTLAVQGEQPAANAITSVVSNAGRNRETGVAAPPVPLNIPHGGSPINPAAVPPPQGTPQASQPSDAQMAAAKTQLASNLTNVANSGVTNPTPTAVGDPMAAQVAAAKGAQTKAEETSKADVEYGSFRQPPVTGSGPGISEPLPTNHGTVIPPVNAQATIPSDPGVIKEKLPSWQKTTADWTNSIAPAQLAQQRLTTIANAFKAIETGTFTTQKADIAAALKGVGLDASNILGDPAQAQLALHENYAETMTQLKAATSRFTQQEFKITSENKQHPNIQPAANLQMLSEDMGALQQQQDVVNDWSAANKAGWKDPQSYEAEYLKANPLPRYVQQFKQQIGPLKGMTNTNTTGASPPSPHTPEEIQAEMRRRGLIQ
jgi:hypothetical protein